MPKDVKIAYMPLTFVTGPAGSGKTRFCLERLREPILDPSKNPCLLLVPEQESHIMELAALRGLPFRGMSRSRVVTFRRLKDFVEGELGIIPEPMISNPEKLVLLREIAEEFDRKNPIFRRAGAQAGFVKEIASILSDLKEQGVSAEALRRGAEGISADSSSPEGERLQGVAFLLEEYERRLRDSKMQDQEDVFIILSSILERETALFKSYDLYIDSFSGFTKSELKALLHLISACRHSYMTLCIDEERREVLFVEAQRTYLDLREGASALGIRIEEDIKLPLNGENRNYRQLQGSDLSKAESELFEDSGLKSEAEGDIRIIPCDDIWEEAETAAREIQLLRLQGISLDSIVVVTRDLAGYREPIEYTLREFGIPFFYDEKEDIVTRPLFRWLRSFVEVWRKRFKQEDLLEFLSSPFTPGQPEDKAALEIFAIRNGVEGPYWEESLERISGGKKETSMSAESPEDALKFEQFRKLCGEMEQIREIAIGPLVDIIKGVPCRLSLRRFLEKGWELLQEYDVPKSVSSLSGGVGGFFQDLELLSNAFQALSNISTETELDLDQHLKLLEEAMRSGMEKGIPVESESVLVTDIEQSRLPEIHHLILLGMNEGLFPKAPVEGPILNEKDIETINGLFTSPLIKTLQERMAQERYLFYIACSRPRRGLTLTYSRHDPGGKELRPSVYLDELKRAYSNPDSIIVDSMRKKAFQTTALIEGDLWWKIRVYLMNEEERSRIRARILIRALADGGRESIFQVLESYPRFDARVDRALLGLIISPDHLFSPTSFEGLLACPFKYFASKIMDLKRVEPYEITPIDEGDLYHRVLKVFYETLPQELLDLESMEEAETLEKHLEHLDFAFERAIAGIGTDRFRREKRNQFFASKFKEELRRFLKGEIAFRKEMGNRPYLLEWEFGNDEVPPLVLSESDITINFRGRIDRIDILPDNSLLVLDYKRKDKPGLNGEVRRILSIQLGIYLLAAREIARDHSVTRDKRPETREKGREKVAGAFNYAVRASLRRGQDDRNKMRGIAPADSSLSEMRNVKIVRHSREGLDSYLEEMKGKIALSALKIRSGEVTVEPDPSDDYTSSCRYCDYSDFCRFVMPTS